MNDKEPEVQISRPYDEEIQPDTTGIQDVKHATEKQPENKLTIGIGSSGGFISIEFNAPVQKIIMTKSHAREFARRISKEALS